MNKYITWETRKKINYVTGRNEQDFWLLYQSFIFAENTCLKSEFGIKTNKSIGLYLEDL